MFFIKCIVSEGFFYLSMLSACVIKHAHTRAISLLSTHLLLSACYLVASTCASQPVYMLWPDLQLPARFKTGRPAPGSHVCVYVYVYSRRWLPSFCRICSKVCHLSYADALYLLTSIACIHTRVLATSAVSARKYRMPFAAPVLCRCLASARKHGNDWLFGLAAVSYCRIRPAAALGQPAVKRAGL